jgi:hypothetical protein
MLLIKIGWDPESEYQHEYYAKRGEYGKKGDPSSKDQSVFLRSSQFMLGNSPMNYQTSSQAQSEKIPEKGRYDNRLTDEMKQRLQRSQFTIGSSDSKNDFSTDYNLEYYDKSSLNTKMNPNELKAIKEKLRGSNYDMGNDKLTYISENAGRYTKPLLNYDEIKKTKLQTEKNTKNLRSGHFDLGTENIPWNSSNRAQFTPKKIDNNRYNTGINDLIRRGNFQKYEENRDFKSEAMDSYNKKPLENNRVSDEYKNNLRRNHFDIGDVSASQDMNTVNRVDYRDPRLDKNHSYGMLPLDPNKFRRSQWSINGGSDGNYFNTTYSRTMTPKKLLPQDTSNNANLKTSIQIGGDKMTQEDYQSVYNNNYGNKKLLDGNYYINNSDKDIVNSIKKFNRNSQIEILKGKEGEFNTTMNDYYKYNPNEAKNAFNPIDLEARLNIRGTHYQLGDNNEMETETSNRRDYRAYPFSNVERVSSGKRNMSQIDMRNGNPFDAATIYQTDFTKKPLPREDEGIDLYLFNKYTKGNQ